MYSNIKIWIVLLLLPMFPTVVFYVLFSQQNYFELQGFFKGVAATGPIAAYAFLVWLGWFIYQKITNISPIKSQVAEELTGRWEFESIPANNSKRKGICHVQYKKGTLIANGTIENNGKQAGQWSSIMTAVYENRLLVFYNWREIKGDKEYNFEGICSLIFGTAPINEMSGCWSVVGVTGAAGTVKYTRANE